MIKKSIVRFVCLFLVSALGLSACAATGESTQAPAPEIGGEKVELVVFAAASMTETMTEIAELYKAVAPDVTILYNFDSSGTLKTQIQEGADVDIFISAGQKQMNQLDITADPAVNEENLDFVIEDTRFNLVKNTVVLIVPEASTADISTFEDVATDKVSLLAIGNSDVPVGQYAEEILTFLGLWDQLNADQKISFGSNVKEVLSQVEANSVDAGIVYSTDAATATGVKVVAVAPEESAKPPVYPAAVMKPTNNEAAARAFLEFLKTDECKAIFEKVGFIIP